jgi:hypothetical protein
MMSTPFTAPGHRSADRSVARSSLFRRIFVAVLSAVAMAPAIAAAQPAPPAGAAPTPTPAAPRRPGRGRPAPVPAEPPPPDPTIELKARLDAEEAARKAAEDRLTAAEKAVADQAAAAKAAQDALAAQGTKLDALAKALDAEHAAREAAAAETAKAAAAQPTPVRARFANIALSGFAQLDFAHRQSSSDQLVDATGEPLNEDRFNLRRARLKITADHGRVSGGVELDASTNKGPQARVVGAEASLALVAKDAKGGSPAVVGAGVFKIPFGQEVVESDADRLFIDRSTMARALFPGEFDVGARLTGTWRFVSYAVAVQNGEPIGEKAFPGRDPNAAKDITGRVSVDTNVGKVHVIGGFSALSGKGFHKGTPATKDTLVWRDINEDGAVELNEILVIPGSAAVPSENFGRFAVGGDLRLGYEVPSLGLLELRGELTIANNLDRGLVIADPVSSTRDLRELGWYLQAVQALPHHLLAGVRYDHYDPDADVTDRQSGVIVPTTATFSSLALTVAADWQNGRLIVEYDHNRNHQGRDVTGVPANLKDDALTVRAQVKF